MFLSVLDKLRKIFYIVTIDEVSLDETDTMPKYLLNDGIPIFILLIILEFLILSFIKNKNFVNLKTTVKELFLSLNIGATEQLFSLLLDVTSIYSGLFVYNKFYYNYRINTIDVKSNKYISFMFLFILKDFSYYWVHRLLHEYHILWTSHSVHHSGQKYNLATGLRQGALQNIFSVPFLLPASIIGFPPQSYFAHAQLNTMYQFWVHTDLVDNLPFNLEYIFNSPSAHRMHHRPPGNCNYGGVLIIWDKIFGTYKHEIIKTDNYGLVKKLKSNDPLYLNIQHFDVFSRIKKGFVNKYTTRRVPWKWKFNILDIFKIYPKTKIDSKIHFNKECINDFQSTLTINVILVFKTLLILIFGKKIYQNHLALIIILQIMSLSFIYKMWNDNKSINLILSILMIDMVYIINWIFLTE